MCCNDSELELKMDFKEHHEFRSAALNNSCLPTKLQIVNNLLYLSQKNLNSKNNNIDPAGKELIAIWKRTSIPTLSLCTVKRRIQKAIKESEAIIKSNMTSTKSSRKTRAEKYELEKADWHSLFDIVDPKNKMRCLKEIRNFFKIKETRDVCLLKTI